MPIKSIDAKTLKSWIKNNEALIVDVREPAEHRVQRIADAKSIPLGFINKNKIQNYEGKKLVIHCHSGKRSAAACEKLLKEDPNLEIYDLEGGIVSWCSCGHETEGSKTFFLPLDRQVQLTIGSFVFLGSALGYFCCSFFIFIPAFFGAGLIFSSLSGYCGLAIFLAKMPWNKVAGQNPSSF